MIKSFFASQVSLINKTRQYLNNAYDQKFRPNSLIVSDQTPFQVIARQDLVSVRYYPPLDEEALKNQDDIFNVSQTQKEFAIPVLLIPPLGVSAWIFDLLLDRSLVRHFLSHGFAVYLVDWGIPTRNHAHISLDDYVLRWLPTAVAAVKSHHSAQTINLVGYCMGGLLSLMYAATAETEPNSIVTIASPIDFHSGSWVAQFAGLLSRPLMLANRLTQISILNTKPDKFHVSGERMATLFQLFRPWAGLTHTIDLLLNMADRQYVADRITLARWFGEMVDFPGATAQRVIANLWIRNQLSKGRMELEHTTVDCHSIKCPLLAFAGADDQVVPIAAAEKILEIVSSTDKTFRVVPGGHAAVFAGAKAPQATWRLMLDWLAHRS